MNATQIATAIEEHDKLDDQIRGYLYPKLYKLYNEGNLHDGDLPKRKKAEEALSISSFSSSKNQINVSIELWWGGDIYDSFSVHFPIEIWDAI